MAFCPPIAMKSKPKSASAQVVLTSEKWGWPLLRAERMTITRGGQSNAYYGVKILGFKFLIWNAVFDRTEITQGARPLHSVPRAVRGCDSRSKQKTNEFFNPYHP